MYTILFNDTVPVLIDNYSTIVRYSQLDHDIRFNLLQLGEITARASGVFYHHATQLNRYVHSSILRFCSLPLVAGSAPPAMRNPKHILSARLHPLTSYTVDFIVKDA